MISNIHVNFLSLGKFDRWSIDRGQEYDANSSPQSILHRVENVEVDILVWQ